MGSVCESSNGQSDWNATEENDRREMRISVAVDGLEGLMMAGRAIMRQQSAYISHWSPKHADGWEKFGVSNSLDSQVQNLNPMSLLRYANSPRQILQRRRRCRCTVRQGPSPVAGCQRAVADPVCTSALP